MEERWFGVVRRMANIVGRVRTVIHEMWKVVCLFMKDKDVVHIWHGDRDCSWFHSRADT